LSLDKKASPLPTTTKNILLAFLLSAFGATALAQRTYTAASCNLSDVQAAFNQELANPMDGDIISIPSGTCTWSGNTMVSASFTTSVTIQGQGAVSSTDGGASVTGSDRTIIYDNINHTSGASSAMAISAPSGKSLRISGIAFLMNGSSSVAGNGILSIGGSSASERVDHCHFYLNRSGAVGLHIAGRALGVVDHVYFDASSGTLTNDFAIHNGREWNGDTQGWGDRSWTDTDHFGTNQFFFLEDNRFHNGDPGDGASGARYVLRYNTVTVDSVSGLQGQMFNHGLTPGRYRGMRAAEVYNNTFVQPGPTGAGNPAYSSNSGTLLFWGNTISQYRYGLDIGYTRKDNAAYGYSGTPGGWGYCGTAMGPSNWDQNIDSSGYPCLDAPARGAGDLLSGMFPNVVNTRTGTIAWAQQVRSPIYVWGNNFTPSSGYTGTNLVNVISMLKANVDYYQSIGGFNGTAGIGNGLLSARPTTCTAGPGGNTAGVGYWATDQTKLYVCTATNTWTSYYTPYTYPHPLTQGTVTPPPSGPAPPTNLVYTIH